MGDDDRTVAGGVGLKEIFPLAKRQVSEPPQRLQDTFGVQAHYLTDPFDGAQILRLRPN